MIASIQSMTAVLTFRLDDIVVSNLQSLRDWSRTVKGLTALKHSVCLYQRWVGHFNSALWWTYYRLATLFAHIFYYACGYVPCFWSADMYSGTSSTRCLCICSVRGYHTQPQTRCWSRSSWSLAPVPLCLAGCSLDNYRGHKHRWGEVRVERPHREIKLEYTQYLLIISACSSIRLPSPMIMGPASAMIRALGWTTVLAPGK